MPINSKNKFNVVLLEIRNNVTLYKFTLGLDYLTAVLRDKNYSAWDFMFESEDIETMKQKILSVEPNIIGISFYRETEETVFELTRAIKKVSPDIKIYLGGHTATLYAAQILKKESTIDFIINGEGELTTLEVCKLLSNKEDLTTCKGVTYRKDKIIMRNENREFIKSLDDLPFPALDTIKEKGITSNYIFAGISTSRGCLGKCGFCVANRYYKDSKNLGWRGRSPKSIVNEIKHIKNVFPNKRIFYTIVDSSIEDPCPKSKERLKEFVTLLEENNLFVPFNCFTRAESWSEDDSELIQRLKNVGLFEVSIGYESSNAKTLAIFNKRAAVEDNYRACRVFKKNNVNVFGFLIMFHPYTTLEELRSNADLLINVNMAYHPQSWWQTLDLWPDSRMFLGVAMDGLLIGPEEKGYLFKYAFEDGRVEKINEAMKLIQNSKSSLDYINTNEKIKLECLLYNAWKVTDNSLTCVKQEMDEYEDLYEKNKEYMSLRQYELFMSLIKYVESGRDNSLINQAVNDWIELLKSNQIELEKMWMKFTMRLRRKNVDILGKGYK
ncbi:MULTISPECIES: B12-binding domain-containing radical SAM protein [Clostridium]|uniref:B12-binding domain-containing radical SAM protein n=1 Tax=Clostridium TaxID=1485 RepID=UPI000825C271|nr:MULTISPECIES: radical SAM protein [Clostridium]PJI06517.1 radical SAM protein [Clostridium sp. CT7]